MLNITELYPEIANLDVELNKLENPPVAMLVAKHRSLIDNTQLPFNFSHDRFLKSILIYDEFSRLSASEIIGEKQTNAFREGASEKFMHLLQE